MSMKAYETPNLLSESGVAITPDTSQSYNGYDAVNLIQNLSIRSGTYSWKPYDETGVQVTYDSCFITTQDQLAANNHQLVLGIDLGQSYFMHAILIVQDMWS